MPNGKTRQSFDCVIVDLNTQKDLFEPRGACPVVDAAAVYTRLRRVIAWGKRNQVPFISSMQCHRLLDLGGNGLSKHCVDGSPGQGKLAFTLFPNRTFVAGDNTLAVPVDLFRRHQQVIFPQRSEDLFANPKADRFMTQLPSNEFVICGAIVEHAVKAVALGLLLRNRRVTVVVDACGCWSRSESDLALRQMSAKGAELVSVDELLVRRLARRFRYTLDSLVAAQRTFGPPNGHCASRNGSNGSSEHADADASPGPPV